MGEATKVDTSQNVAEMCPCPLCSRPHFPITLWCAVVQLVSYHFKFVLDSFVFLLRVSVELTAHFAAILVVFSCITPWSFWWHCLWLSLKNFSYYYVLLLLKDSFLASHVTISGLFPFPHGSTVCLSHQFYVFCMPVSIASWTPPFQCSF